MKKSIITILSLLAIGGTCLIGGCTPGQTGSGQSLENQTENVARTTEENDELPDTQMPDDDKAPNDKCPDGECPEEPPHHNRHRRHGHKRPPDDKMPEEGERHHKKAPLPRFGEDTNNKDIENPIINDGD